MATKWTRLGEKLRAGRRERGIGVQQIADLIGVRRGAIGNIEKGQISKITPTIRKFAYEIGWTADSPERVIADGEPVLREPATEPSEDAPGDALADPLASTGLSLRVQESLRQGPLLHSEIAEVVTPTGRVRATIVIRGEDGTSAEELLASLRALDIRVSTDSSDIHSSE